MLYLLTPINILNPNKDPWEPWYNKAFGFVVRANTEKEARKLASKECGEEKTEAWLNPEYSTCVELLQEGESMIILRDFAAA